MNRVRHAGFWLVAMAVLLSGCVGRQYHPVRIDDGAATVVSGRLSWLPREQQVVYRPGDLILFPDEVMRDGVEVQYLAAHGTDSDTIPAGSSVRLGDDTLAGPRPIDNQVDFTYGHVAYSGTMISSALPFELTAFMGLGQVAHRTTVKSSSGPAASLSRADEELVLSMGLGVQYRFDMRTALEGRITVATHDPRTYFFDTFGNGDQTDLLQYELALSYRPITHLALRGGYTHLRLAPHRYGGSPLDYTLTGIFVGAGLEY